MYQTRTTRIHSLQRRGLALCLSAGLSWSVFGALVNGFQSPVAPSVRVVDLASVVVIGHKDNRTTPGQDRQAGETRDHGPKTSQYGKLTQLMGNTNRQAL